MVLQTNLFKEEICKDHRLFYRKQGNVQFKDGYLTIEDGAEISTDTYMNMFDFEFWQQFCSVSECCLELEFCGDGTVSMCSWCGEKENIFYVKKLSSKTERREIVPIHPVKDGGMIYFTLTSESRMQVRRAAYTVTETGRREIHLSLVMCTYKRNDYVWRNLEVLKQSCFFDRQSSLFGKMSVHIVDNASELPEMREPFIHIHHNPNTGGSGGFTRGILESRKEDAAGQVSHIIFMDDDVCFMEESFYRLYALLSLLLPCYSQETVAGRMFRMDNKTVQYTACEVWNKGNLIHMGHEKDMTAREGLLTVNKERGEYGGWWFCCFPIEFAKENLPLPFFLHCDDVEYGLRCGKSPLVLNGIQVWHETAEHRMTPEMAYYDIRNSFIVNTIYGGFEDWKELLERWRCYIGMYHREKQYALKYAAVSALKDYMRGSSYFLSCTKKKTFFSDNPKVLKLGAAISWRITGWIYKRTGKKAFQSYRGITCRYSAGQTDCVRQYMKL